MKSGEEGAAADWPVDWPGRWRAKEAELEAGGWQQRDYRRNHALMQGIETAHKHWEEFRDRCAALGVPVGLMEDDPDIGGPLGGMVWGVFTTASSMKHAAYVHRIGQQWDPLRHFVDVLEIGGGYGAFILAASRVFNVGTYYCADSDVMHRLRRHHIGRWREKHGVALFDSVDLPPDPYEIDIERVDLVVATNVLVEIPRAMLDGYICLIQEKLVKGGLFYTENNLSREVKSNAELGLDGHWEYVTDGQPWGAAGWGEVMAVRWGN